MIWHLIAAVFAGLAAAGIGLLLRTLSAKRLPKWIVPVFGGLGMLSYQVYTEYSWFDHKQAQLPDSAEIVSTQTSSAVWRPWTFAFPIIKEFTVIDRDSVRLSEGTPVLAEFMLYHFERYHTDVVTPQAYVLNCRSRELMPLDSETGEGDVDAMRMLRQDSGIYSAICHSED
ncbi:hypothetical protein QC823_00580 [Halomonas vilamensis]|uniref:Uncharacterized protein n=1 Tax=Vreelandella vilamensis TaxID=531309 RepID=A0ABU1H1U1_9GAMM|nr:hypothetical protein [Halomonas vilamensis]MDR5897493.1 hypothetical protein [Halomonas vilamensis]